MIAGRTPPSRLVLLLPALAGVLLSFLYTILPIAPYVLTHVNTRYTFTVFFTTACLLGLVADRAHRFLMAGRIAPLPHPTV